MNYQNLLNTLLEIHAGARAGAAGAVNRFLILRNWAIGAHLVEFEQQGEGRAAYGAQLIESIAADLKSKGIQGLGASMLKDCRTCYRIYPQIRQAALGEFAALLPGPIRQSPIGESADLPAAHAKQPQDHSPPLLALPLLLRLSWTHILELIRIDDPWMRAFYENECIAGAWSVRQFKRQVESLLYERTGLSTDKQAVIARARQQGTSDPRHISELMRDPYVLEFTGLAEKATYHESDLETALLNHLQTFLLELGDGFCFEARQKRITVGTDHDYIDLVFYHRKLRCHLLIDLKIWKFRHGDAGQMNYYLNYWKAHEMEDGDNPPVGLILCAGKDAAKAQYATAGMDQLLFVSRYLVALPKPEELQALITADRFIHNRQISKSP